ncbi:MAG: hypothetical protein V3V78_00450 [Candidatus Woesearchaeota archaeon]
MSEEKTTSLIIETVSKKNLGIKAPDCWYNIGKLISGEEKEAAKKVIETLGPGDKIDLTLITGTREYSKVELLEKAPKGSGSGWGGDIIHFDTLLNEAHSDKHKVKSIKTEMLAVDLEKSYALFKCVAEDKNGNIFQAHGDATKENIKKIEGSDAHLHWIRIAETRAIARALRFLTNNSKCSDVEISNEEKTDNPEEPIPIEEIKDLSKKE